MPESNVRLVGMYKVGYSYTETGSVIVHATDPEQAERIVQKMLDEDGLDQMARLFSYATDHRDYSVEDVEEVS